MVKVCHFDVICQKKKKKHAALAAFCDCGTRWPFIFIFYMECPGSRTITNCGQARQQEEGKTKSNACKINIYK